MTPRLLAPMAACLLLVVAAVPARAADPSPSASPSSAAPSSSPSPGASEAPAELGLPGGGGTFADYELVPLLPDSADYAGPSTPHSLDGVRVTNSVRQILRDPATRRALLRRGFVVIPSETPLFSMAYDSQAYSGTPVFVTTDAVYDAWHLIFDKILRQLETNVLSPKLADLITGMLAKARAQRSALTGTALAQPAGRVVQMIALAGRQLGVRVGQLGPAARAEQQLIEAHDQLTTSPILGTDIDYSLFTPRGHYTRTAALTRYFLAMSVLGQMAFALPGAEQFDGSRADQSGLRLAALATRTLVGDPELEALWQDIYEPTAFLVGLSDDYSPFELAAAIESTSPGAMSDPAPLADDAAIDQVAAQLKATRPVRIDTERPSVRLMGTRFVVDSWIMDQLLYPNVGTADEPRLLPSPLDIAAAFGSDFAYRLQRQAGQTAYAHYDDQMAAMRDAVASRPDEDWGTTIYDAWLAAIEPMWLPHGTPFPDFMRTPAWTAKAQQSGFGSYAELKHDTILYTKQAVGELGGSGPTRVPRHWVEPDPVPFERLAAMADLERQGLDDRGLLPRRMDRLLADFSDMATFLARIATDELAGEPISRRDNERLGNIGGTLEAFWWRTADGPRLSLPAADESSAIVADIASGRDHVTGEITVVEVATGYIDQVLVLVPDDQGTFQVAEGGVYSYYEFLQPVSDRLTDEAWRAMLSNGDQPDRPAWTARTRP